MVAMVMMVMMSAAPALAHENNGNKTADGADANQGGGQEHARNTHPDHAGGDKHGGGIV
jgi:hypothetical protein